MIRRGIILCAALLAVLLSAPVMGANLDALDRGPKIGARVAQTVNAVDQGGQHRNFKSLARRRGLIILFTRSLDW